VKLIYVNCQELTGAWRLVSGKKKFASSCSKKINNDTVKFNFARMQSAAKFPSVLRELI